MIVQAGLLLHGLVQDPPSATLASWKPRQMPKNGMPRASARGMSGSVQTIAIGIERKGGVVHRLVEVARVHVRCRAGEQDAIGQVEQLVDLVRLR